MNTWAHTNTLMAVMESDCQQKKKGHLNQQQNLTFQSQNYGLHGDNIFFDIWIASKLNNEGFEVQVNALLYCMSTKAKQIDNPFSIRKGLDSPEATFNNIIQVSNRHFTPKINIIHESLVTHQNVTNNLIKI